jgi:hemolysin activation/secretion protein
LRGALWKVGYDAFAGVPFSHPDGFKTSPATFGFNLNMDF